MLLLFSTIRITVVKRKLFPVSRDVETRAGGCTHWSGLSERHCCLPGLSIFVFPLLHFLSLFFRMDLLSM